MNILLGLILGLLALVHSSPIDAVTQMPAKGEDDVLREAITDGFLVDHMYFLSITTESPKRNTTVQVTQQPSENEEEKTQTATNEPVVFEASGAGGSGEEPSTTVQQRDEQSTSTKPSLLPVESSTSTVLLTVTDDFDSKSFSTQSPQPGFTSSSVPSVQEEDVFIEETTQSVAPSNITPVSLSTEPADDSSLSTLSPDSISHFTLSPVFGSGDGETGSTPDTPLSATSSSTPDLSSTSHHYNTEQHAPAEASTVPSTLTAGLVTHKAPRISEDFEESGSGMSEEVSTVEANIIVAVNPENANGPLIQEAQTLGDSKAVLPQGGRGTPGWIIILGFVVGLAATVMACVAIATRDKWNGPSQASKVSAKVNSTNQPREQEMETFLQKQAPRENGQTAEYTVIPLEDLTEKDSFIETPKQILSEELRLDTEPQDCLEQMSSEGEKQGCGPSQF